MGQTLLRLLKIICYVALGALLAGFAVLAVLGVLDICPRLDEGGISCVSPVCSKSSRALPWPPSC
jgi:hypothetical protein